MKFFGEVGRGPGPMNNFFLDFGDDPNLLLLFCPNFDPCNAFSMG